MTLSELLHSVSFEEIVPYIGKYQGNEKNIAWYKMHYDLLCQTKPFSGEDDIKSATISYYDDEEDNSLGRLKAYPLEGDYWNVSLAKELIINPEVDASKEEIAACCLWHTSFWGFTKEQRIEIFESWHEDITKAKVKKYKRIYGSELPDKKQMLEKRAFHNYIKREMKIHRNYRSSHFSKEDKRLLGCIKRKWRMWKRWEINNRYNEAVIGRSEYFHKIIESGEEIHPPDPAYLKIRSTFLQAERCNICSFQTYATDLSLRVEYVRELIEKYNILEERIAKSRCIICIGSSPQYCVTDDEVEELTKLITNKCTSKNYDYLKINTDEKLGKEIKLNIAFI